MERSLPFPCTVIEDRQMERHVSWLDTRFSSNFYQTMLRKQGVVFRQSVPKRASLMLVPLLVSFWKRTEVLSLATRSES